MPVIEPPGAEKDSLYLILDFNRISAAIRTVGWDITDKRYGTDLATGQLTAAQEIGGVNILLPHVFAPKFRMQNNL